MPEKSDHGPVTILFSSADKQVYVYRNGAEIGCAPFANSVRGMHVYSALDGADAEGKRKWVRVDGAPASNDPSFTEVARGGGYSTRSSSLECAASSSRGRPWS